MKKLIVLPIIFFVLLSSSQDTPINLTFTAIDSLSYVQMDSIKIMNRTQDCDTVLYFPDTVLTLGVQTGMEIYSGEKRFHLFNSFPNPTSDNTTFRIFNHTKAEIRMVVSDVLGRTLLTKKYTLEMGFHSFKYTPGDGRVSFVTVRRNKNSKSIKVLHPVKNNLTKPSLEYIGIENLEYALKTSISFSVFYYNMGDTLLYVGYNDTLESGILGVPELPELITFQFAYNIPCPGTPTVDYEEQVYNTVQVFSQCWLKENLNVGTMIQGSQEMTDNDTIEKYCYDNEPDSCSKYGGLYQWDEIMQYTTQQGVQGICPQGWHVPTIEEWKILMGAVDSQFGIGHPEWDVGSYSQGFDVGKRLKSENDWGINYYGIDLVGFNALPAGSKYYTGFSNLGNKTRFWTSIKKLNSNSRGYIELSYSDCIGRSYAHRYCGYSVRCIKD